MLLKIGQAQAATGQGKQKNTTLEKISSWTVSASYN